MQNSPKGPAYVAYIDEAGDDGLNTVRPIDANGGCEWLMLSAILIDIGREQEADAWLSEILNDLPRYRLKHLHFKHCNTIQGRIVCEKIAALPLRAFVVASNKKNMRRYQNPFAAQIPSKNWFYCWLTRLLLERVTYAAFQRSMRDYGEPRLLQIEFSERGRFSYPQLMAYYQWLKMKTQAGRNMLPLGDLSWEVMSRQYFQVRPNEDRSGLQLADAIASAFLRACDIHSVSNRDAECAKLLEPRMAREPDTLDGRLHGFGVKLMPGWGKARLLPPQQEIFRHYGYPNPQWWMPTKK